MLERFTERARHVVDVAERQARELSHMHIGTEHLLLALIETMDAADTEEVLGIPAAQIRGTVVGAIGLGRSPSPKRLPFSSEARAVLQQAPLETPGRGEADVEPVHILLALIGTDGCTAADVLRMNGVDLDRVRRLVTGQERAAPRSVAPAEPTPRLHDFTRNLVRTESGARDPVVGRSREIDRVVQVLTQQQRNVPLLVGEPGVGKDAVATGVALALHEGRVPASLRGHSVRALDLGAVLAEPQHRARGAAVITDLLNEVRRSAHTTVLYLDGALTPLHLPDGTTTPLGLFRSLLGLPGVRVFGSCGRAEYERRGPDPGFDRLVQPVFVEEPPADDVLEILRTVRTRLSGHHDMGFTDEALEAAAALARDHVPDQSLPGAAIGLLDEAAALVRMRAVRQATPPDQRLDVAEADVVQALAASSGIRAPGPARRPAAAQRVAPPAEHDPYVWSMS